MYMYMYMYISFYLWPYGNVALNQHEMTWRVWPTGHFLSNPCVRWQHKLMPQCGGVSLLKTGESPRFHTSSGPFLGQ